MTYSLAAETYETPFLTLHIGIIILPIFPSINAFPAHSSKAVGIPRRRRLLPPH